jgi:hypothetical protein
VILGLEEAIGLPTDTPLHQQDNILSRGLYLLTSHEITVIRVFSLRFLLNHLPTSFLYAHPSLLTTIKASAPRLSTFFCKEAGQLHHKKTLIPALCAYLQSFLLETLAVVVEINFLFTQCSQLIFVLIFDLLTIKL